VSPPRVPRGAFDAFPGGRGGRATTRPDQAATRAARSPGRGAASRRAAAVGQGPRLRPRPPFATAAPRRGSRSLPGRVGADVAGDARAPVLPVSQGGRPPDGGASVKVGVLSPTTWQLVEKMAALFPEGVEVVGPLADDGHYWNDYRRKAAEWSDLGLQVSLRIAPYAELD